VTETRFNRLYQQQTWAYSCMSCPPGTPTRSFDGDVENAETIFSYGGIRFVHIVTTTFNDICLSPSTRQLIGIFTHPNVFAVLHDLLPVFSTSKLLSFQDILYPSPYTSTGQERARGAPPTILRRRSESEVQRRSPTTKAGHHRVISGNGAADLYARFPF
jgi:hypothetical protein